MRLISLAANSQVALHHTGLRKTSRTRPNGQAQQSRGVRVGCYNSE